MAQSSPNHFLVRHLCRLHSYIELVNGVDYLILGRVTCLLGILSLSCFYYYTVLFYILIDGYMYMDRYGYRIDMNIE